MSISTVRHIFEKPVFAFGCSAVMGIAIIVGLFNVNCMAGRQGQGEQLAQQPIAKVGSQSIGFADVESTVASSQPAPTPAGQAASYAQAIRQQINAAKEIEFAKSKGIELSVEGAKEAIPGFVAESVAEAKNSLQQMGMIKEGASDADVDKAFSQIAGKNLATYQADQQADLMRAIEDPARQDLVLAALVQRLLINQYSNGVSVSDAQLEQSFDKITHKKIEFNSKDEADKALAEIKGGMSFEAAIDKYNKVPPPTGKKASEVTQELERRFFSTNPVLTPVANLKEGEVSEVLDAGYNNYAIYKIISVKSNKPADFDTKKEQYRKELAQALGGMQYRKDQEAFVKNAPVEWVDPGFKVLYDVDELLSGATPLDKAELDKRLTELEAQAKSIADTGEAVSQRPALLAQFYANERLYITNPNDKDILNRRIEVAQKMLQSSESIELRLELVEQLADLGRGKEAADELVQAARLNFDLGNVGAQNRQKIGGFLERLREEKTITEQQGKDVEAELKRWADEKKRQDEYEAQQKKEQAEAQKKYEEEQKKAEAEAKNKAKTKGN